MRTRLLTSTAPAGAQDAAGTRPSTPMAYSVEDAADETTTSRDTIYRAIRKGELRAHKIGSRTVILGEDLRAYLVSRPAIKAAWS